MAYHTDPQITRSIIFILCLSLVSISFGQTLNYDDVAVIYNVNSPASQQIAVHFQNARSIPQINLIPVDVPASEEIDLGTFQILRAQVEDHLLNNGIVETINYLVTTKDIPLRINGDCNSMETMNNCSSVEMELALILGPYAEHIGSASTLQNPFVDSEVHHSKIANGIYLVTRLDGHTVDDVIDLIDRSGPGINVDRTTAWILAHIDMFTISEHSLVETMLTPTRQQMTGMDWNMIITSADTSIVEASNLIGFIGIAHYPAPMLPVVEWLPGGMAIELSPYSAYTFSSDLEQPAHSRLADRVAEGATGLLGSTRLTFFTDVGITRTVFSRYFDTTWHFGLAESFYAGINTLSSLWVVIGDPKTSITLLGPSGVVGSDASPTLLYPNPTTGILTIRSMDPHFKLERIIDLTGRTVWSGKIIGPVVSIDLTNEMDGLYILQMKDGTGRSIHRRVVLQR